MRTYGNGRPLSYSSFKPFFNDGLSGYFEYCTKERKESHGVHILLDRMFAGLFEKEYLVCKQSRLPFPESSFAKKENKALKTRVKGILHKTLLHDGLKSYQDAVRAYQWIQGIKEIDREVRFMLSGNTQSKAIFKINLDNGKSLDCIGYADFDLIKYGYDLKCQPIYMFEKDWKTHLDIQTYFYIKGFGWDSLTFFVLDTQSWEYTFETKTLSDCRVEEIEKKLIEFSDLWDNDLTF